MIAKGQKISDRYQILKSVGEGGMANVYLAYDTILDRNVAVKVLRGDLANDEKFVRRFQREALSASSLSHPNIVEVYDVGEDNGEYYIVMEYVEGKHLKQLLKKRGKLTIPEVVDIGLQITAGLAVAHDSFIIHRDIKPQNILILDNGLIKITDFGIAVAMNSTQLTQTNSVMGSVHYLPPEQASGKGATLQSDIYSIGIMLYELLTGKLPFKGDNAVEIALKHLKDPFPSIREELPDIPQALENIIIRATAKNPKNRYADAREMHEDLKTCLDESRANELKITLKYPENDFEDRPMKILKTKPKEEVKNISNEKVKEQILDEDDNVVAKKMTKQDMKKQNKFLILLLSIFTTLVVIITTILVLIPKITSTSQINVPNVSNKSVQEAIRQLQDAGFKVTDEQISQPNSEIQEGYVIKTSPAAESKRKKGSEITLYVSTGTDQIIIEDYTGKNINEIKGKLEALGLQVLIEKKDVDASETEYDEDSIIEQSVKSGESLTIGDKITLYSPSPSLKYPDFTNGTYTISDVESWGSDNGITVKIKYVKDENKSDGDIIAQSKIADQTKVRKGETLTITVVKNSDKDPEQEDNGL